MSLTPAAAAYISGSCISVSGGATVFFAPPLPLPPGQTVIVAAPPPAVRSPIDILMVTTMALVWTVNSTLSWGCNYVMQWNLG